MNKILDEWKVNTNINTPLYKQLAENIRWSISTGKVTNGWTLPPLRQLASKFNLSVNTVRAAYKLLEEQQLVVTRPHHGTEVVNLLVPKSIKPNDDISATTEDYISDAISKAFLSGYGTEEIRSMFERALERAAVLDYSNRILFVECSEHDARSLGEQISSTLGIYVDPVILEDLGSYLSQLKTSKHKYEAIVTTYFHYATVMQVAQSYDMPIYGVVVEMGSETLNYISSMPAQSKIGLVCQPDHSVQYLHNSLQSITKDLEIKTAFSQDTEELKEIINWGDAFIVTQPCERQVKELSPSGPVFFFYDRINDQSMTMLKEYLRQQKAGDKDK